MDFRDKNPNEAPPAPDASKESSPLYSRANLHGTKHRDFSALHRESRNPARHRADLHEDQQPVVMSATAKPLNVGLYEDSVFRPSRETDNPPRIDGVERRKGVRRAEDVVMAETMAGTERRVIVDPAQRQAARDTEFDLRRRQATVPQTSHHSTEDIADGKIYREFGCEIVPSSQAASTEDTETSPGGNSPYDICPEEDFGREAISADALSEPLASPGSTGPAWLYAPPTLPITAKPLGTLLNTPSASVAETLQYSRERVASRWFALKGVFEQTEDPAEATSLRQKETRTPVLAVYSLAGGVGKTSLVATIGRSLSAMGEKVLLTDTTSHGLLPFYFGANELQHDTVRTFSPPSGSTDAPIYLVSHQMEARGSDQSAQELFAEELVTNSQGMHRILLDLSATASWVIRQMARVNLTVLVPVAPDMNSVISMGFVEKFFSGLIDSDARPLQPFYVLNQFDPSLPLHLDVREVLRRKLGDRLLPFVIRRAPAVSEALAEGMTVVDYAPDAPVAEDYLNLATWLRTIAAPAAAGFRNVRWTER